jgi:hypothetical protein
MRWSPPKKAGLLDTTARNKDKGALVNRPLQLGALFLTTLAIAACNAGGSSNVPATAVAPTTLRSASSPLRGIPEWQAKHLARAACPLVIGKPTCQVLIGTNGHIDPLVAGLAPTDIQTRYNLPSSTDGSGQIVAIVDAYDQPNAASDLATYRTEFGLGTANFTKYNQNGQTSNYPQSCAASSGWCVEEDLDIEMVSAACPKCTIYLIEANGADTTDLQTAELEAVTLGAHIVSNSWDCLGSNTCLDTSDFDQPGVLYLAATGDYGYNVIGAPATLASVVAVAGTTLTKTGSGTYTETVWPDAGAGCANGVTKPSWQHDPDCTSRTVGDVSAVACICVAEYDSNEGGWFEVGGTSVATPINGAIFALAGNASSQKAAEKFWSLKVHARRTDLHVITAGNDGSASQPCADSYLCEAGTHQFHDYSGPAGWGTPNGIVAY